MSKASLPPSPAANHADSGRFVEYDRFIKQQVDKTRGHVRGIDITGALMTLAAGTLAFFLVATILDHWLIPGGLGSWGRTLLCAALAAGVGYYAAIELVPLCLRRINPVYAAHAIERGTPSLKNGLVNFLLLKNQRAALSEPVFEAIEEQAATGLARVSADATVDRSRLIKLGYVLVALLTLAAFYKVLSPKDPLTTIGRVMLPWSDIQPPTRVSISDVTPGTTQAFRGQRVEVSAAVRGLTSDGEVRLVFATADGQSVNQVIRMTMPASSMRYTCALPESSAGLQQDLDYHIEAGDARTRTYRVTVVAAPTIVVQAVDYIFPEYTGLAPQRIEHQGDIKGIEGTRVTLHALANQDIKSGAIDFNCDGREDQQLSIDGQHATGSFTLELSDDRRGPAYASYQLRFRNAAGQENPQPIAHRIEVTPDLPPEIEFLAPKSPELDVPARSSVGLEIAANDPDFALRRVRLMAQVGEKLICDKLLLDEPRAGQFTKKLWFGTARTGLKAGDVVEYWAVAEDIKSPQPNRVETAHRRLRIVSPNQQQSHEDQVASRDDEIRSESSGKSKQEDDQQGDSKSERHGKAEPQGAGAQGNGANDRDQQDNQDPNGGKARADQPAKGERSGDEQAAEKERQQPAEQPKPGEQQSGDASAQQGGEKQKGGQSGQGGTGDDENGVPADGSDDGSAIEKILKDRQKGGKGADAEVGDPSQNPQQDGQQEKPGDRGNDQGKSDQGKSDQGKSEGGSSKSPGNKDSSGSAGKEAGGAGGGTSQPQGGEKGQRPDGKSNDDAERQQQAPGPGGLNPLKSQDGDKGTGGNPKKGLGQKGPGDRPGTTEGQQDDTQSPNQPGGAGSKNEPAAGNDTKPADKSEQGSAPGAQQRRPGSKQSQRPGESPSQQGGPGDGQSQPADNDKNGDKHDGPTERGGPNDRGQEGGERAPAKPDEPKGGAAGDPQPRESADGSKDGQRKPAQERKPRPGEKTSRTEQGTGDKSQAERGSGQKPGQKLGQKPEQQPDSPQGGQDPNDPAAGKGASPEPKSNNPNDQGQQPGSGDGKGGKSEGDTGRKPQKSPADSGQKPDAKGGDGADNKGQSGAGNSSQDKQGAPAAQGNNQQRDKTQQGGGRNAMQPNDAAQSPSNSERQSDSQGESSGDRSGGGGKGGGQKANKSGTGGAGQNTAADEGAGKSDQPGDGETGDKAGDQKQADGATGKSGSKSGKGSSSRAKPSSPDGAGKPPGDAGHDDGEHRDQPPGEAAKGDKPAGEKQPSAQSPHKPPQQPGQKPASDQKPGQAPQQPSGGQSDKQSGQAGDHSGKPGGAGSGEPRGGGSEGPLPPPGPEDDTPTPADDPNLEYARKATDLALEHLKDQLQRGEPDQELLDKLKWSRQDAEKFVKRLEEMRRKANQQGQQGQTGRKELDDYLRSLGIRPRSTKLQANKGRDDQARGLKESRRSQPPAEYAEQFKAYTQGTSRGGK